MFVLMFTRLTNDTEESAFLIGSYDSKEQAQKRMRFEWEDRINCSFNGWEPEWSYFEDDQAFCGTEDMFDTCRFYIFDTERNTYGFSNDKAEYDEQFFNDDDFGSDE